MTRRSFLAALLAAAAAACGEGAPDDPARRALVERLQKPETLTPAELGALRAEIRKTVDPKSFLKDGREELADEEREAVFGMLGEPAGMFDEGLKTHEGRTYRVLNSPAKSFNQEIEAFRRLYIDPVSLQPRRFEFAHAFAGYGEYAFDLAPRR